MRNFTPRRLGYQTVSVVIWSPGFTSLLFQEFPHILNGCTLVPAPLGQDLKNLALIVYGTLQICSLANNAGKDLIKMPGSRRLNPAGSAICGNGRTELQDPVPDRFIADIDPAFCQHFLNVSEA